MSNNTSYTHDFAACLKLSKVGVAGGRGWDCSHISVFIATMQLPLVSLSCKLLLHHHQCQLTRLPTAAQQRRSSPLHGHLLYYGNFEETAMCTAQYYTAMHTLVINGISITSFKAALTYLTRKIHKNCLFSCSFLQLNHK